MQSPKALSLNSPSATIEYKEIVNLGPRVLPFVMRKLEDDPQMLGITHDLVQKRFNFEKNQQDPDWLRKQYLHWWKEERNNDEKILDELFTKWRETNKKGDTKEAKKIFVKILNMGIIAMPRAMERIMDGDVVFIKMVYNLKIGEVKLDEITKNCLDWWEANKEKWTIPLYKPSDENDKEK